MDGEVILTVVTGYSFSKNHRRFYAGGTRQYHSDGSRHRTLSRSYACACGDPIYDGDRVCALTDAPVSVYCCTQHKHPERL